MLEIILKIINAFYQTVYFILFISYCIGDILSSAGYYLFWTLYYTCTAVLEFIQVLVEDFNIFCCDICEKLNILLIYIFERIEKIFYGIIYGLTFLTYLQTALYTSILYLFEGIFTLLKSGFGYIVFILRLLKDVLIAVGDGIWYAILIIPRTINFCITTIFDQFIFAFINTYQKFKEIIHYTCSALVQLINDIYVEIQEFPYTSIIGLVVLVIVLHFCNKHRSFLRRHLLILLRQTFNALLQLLAVIVSPIIICAQGLIWWRHDRILTGQLLQNADTVDSDVPEAKLCIICRVMEKNIISYPCLHVCMCRSCFMILRSNRDYHCPVCRRNIVRYDRIYYT